MATDSVASQNVPPHMDPDSRAWLDRLGTPGPARDAAIADLHALLLRAARFEIIRRRPAFPHLRGDDLDDLAQQSADDALMGVLTKLSTFRGDSRFTTWAYKFALYEAAVKVRRRAWQHREVQLEPDAWALVASGDHGPQRDAETAELLTALCEAIDSDLTAHQRAVLRAVALQDVPIDVLAERLNTTRGALYKTVHDARQKLRAVLAANGLSIEEHRSST
ncbi:MAG: RNA polymerase sigma factor [Solirubrobacteraceae bacterium]